ncbi:MAG: hypothetical protein O3C63_04925 [Cyanobacteria bacterium]|nr:hypothetical protein [Cyanobacteriota bacterium]MDA1020586.1 hypothetical protein [Cyanobacteriota bacterium]
MTTETAKYKLSKEEKLRMSNRINYFRTMPAQILKTSANLESGFKQIANQFVDHRTKSVLVNGKIMILNMS